MFGYCTVELGDIASIIRGKRFVHNDAKDIGIPCIHYGEVYTSYGVKANVTYSFIRDDLKDKMRYAHKGDIIVVGAGENKEDIGIGVAWLGDDDVAVHDACYILSNHGQNPTYISYCLRTADYHKQLKKYVSEGKICSFSANNLAKIKLFLPPLSIQDHIVSILNQFDYLYSDIASDLPAEIEARQKQYEYYRDKLLTFKEI